MSDVLGWVCLALGLAVLDWAGTRWLRPLGERWARRIDDWFERRL